MANALWITLIGMGLVFIAILLLWGGMALLVRVTAEPEVREPVEDGALQDAAQDADAEANRLASNRRRAAAAAAVSVALALCKPTRRGDHVQSDGGVSAWQAVNRASQINQALNNPRKKVAR